MKKTIHLILTCSMLTIGLQRLIAQPIISFQTLAGGLTQPLDVVNARDGSGRLFIVEKPGTIRIWDGTNLLPTPFLDISSIIRSTGTEQGLLSLAFHPNYATNGYFFVWYNNLQGNVTLARYSRSAVNTADPASGVVLLTIYKPFANHNGAKLNFGPDGYLYFGTGDGGSGGDPGNRAQNGDSLQGKLIRIDVNNPDPPYYSIPSTNPYINNPAIRDEIVGLGLRNPWRWSFDRQTGDLWLADVGQDLIEEVNFLPAGDILDKNFGWRCFEGTQVFNSSCGAQANNVVPIFQYPHNMSTGGFSITGGYVYRGSEFPALQGYYIASDYVSNHGWLIRASGTGSWNASMQATWATGISSYGEAENGTLYAVSLSTGTFYKVIASGALPLRLVSFTGISRNNSHELSWNVATEEKGTIYHLEKRTTPELPFEEISRQMARGSQPTNTYRLVVPGHDAAFYRLRTLTPEGQTIYSAIVYLKGTHDVNSARAVVTGDQLMITLPADARAVSVTDAAGRLLKRNITGSRSGFVNIPLATVAKGVLIINIAYDDRTEQLKTIYW